MLSVTDLCDFSWCPYAFYLKKVLRIRPPPNAAMVRGTILHSIMEQRTRTEQSLMRQETTERSSIDDIRNTLFRSAYQHAKNAVMRHKGYYVEAGGDPLELLSQLKTDVKYDSLIKAASFKKACASKGFETALDMVFPQRKTEVPLQDKGLGLRGRVDAIEEPEPGVMIPIDYKTGYSQDGATDQHRLQIAAYSVLIERVLGCKAPLGMLIFSDYDAHIPVIVDERSKATVLETLDAAKRIMRTKKKPEKKEGKKCSGCLYRQYCT